MDVSTPLAVKCPSSHLTRFMIPCMSLQARGTRLHGACLSAHVSVNSSFVKRRRTHCAACFTRVLDSCCSLSFNTLYSEFLTVWFLRFVSIQTLAVCELNVTGNRQNLLITHDDFNRSFFVAQSNVAGSSLTPLRPSALARSSHAIVHLSLSQMLRA